MQLTFKSSDSGAAPALSFQRHGRQPLAELEAGEAGVLEILDLPDDVARRLMELGFLPGHLVTPSHSAPGGDPRVFRVDGSEIALRRETAQRLWVRPTEAEAEVD
jgi:Fe2+ transport system protein FeoA